MVTLGVENLLERRRDLLAGDRLGLVTNPSGVDSALRSTVDLFDDDADFDLRRLFGPEHGIRGDERAGEAVADSVDDRTGLPVTSLSGETRTPPREALADLDAVVYDLQDVGCRFYPLLYTLGNVLRAVADADRRLVVLDRPNPVAPLPVAGNRVPDTHATLVGDYRLPVVHRLTVGEFARYVNGRFDVGADLDVVELSDWSHDAWYDETGLPWVPPSPDVPGLDTATVYPGTCFFEGTTLSEGRGTTTPFRAVGAPWVDAADWADDLNALGLSGVRFRPTQFTPSLSKHEGEDVAGAFLHVTDREAFRPLRTGLATLVSAFLSFPESDWVEREDGYVVDRLAGGPYLRETVDAAAAGADPLELVDALRDEWRAGRDEFRAERERYTLYD